MMKYELFKDVITERIMEYMPPIFADFAPRIEMVPKVNGAKEALVLAPEEKTEFLALPIVYLDDMYELFMMNEDMDDMLEFIAGIFIRYTGSLYCDDATLNFAEKKDDVILSIVNSELNEEMLKETPHVEILNMSVIFRVIMRWIGDGFDSVIVNDSIMKEMGVDQEELFRLASRNTRRIFPPTVKHMEDNMYVVSNEGNTFGAASMVYEDFMNQVCETVGDDSIYILPSSIHEFFAIPEKGTDIDLLIEMLAEGNSTITRKKDILSNVVYAYDVGSGSIRKAASYH